jgi:hypothetical protein
MNDREIRPGARKHDALIRELLRFGGAATFWQLADAIGKKGSTIYDIIARMRSEGEVEIAKLEQRGFVSQGVVVPRACSKKWDEYGLQLLDTRLQLDLGQENWTWADRGSHWVREKSGVSIVVVSARRGDDRAGRSAVRRIKDTAAKVGDVVIYSDPNTRRADSAILRLRREIPGVEVHQSRHFTARSNPRGRDRERSQTVHRQDLGL